MNRTLGALLALPVAVLVVAGTTYAQGLGAGIGDPCAPGAYDPDAGPAVVVAALPDGGSEDVPAFICAGQRAPAPGVFLTTKQAAALAGEREGLRTQNALLASSLTAADQIPAWAWAVIAVSGSLVSAYVAVKVAK